MTMITDKNATDKNPRSMISISSERVYATSY